MHRNSLIRHPVHVCIIAPPLMTTACAGGDKQWLRTFAQAVLLRLVEEHRWQEFADHSADCLLPFIKADTPAFQSCCMAP